MHIYWAPRVAAIVACAAILTGCGGDGDKEDLRAQHPQTTTPENAPAAATVALRGCVEAAPGTNQYVLRNVEFESGGPNDPQRTTTTPGPHGITEGAWVRLDGSEKAQELRSALGQRVTLTGTIADSGQNTVGTAGTSGAVVGGGDKSQAAGKDHYSGRVKEEAGRIARESMADGTAAQIKVTSVKSNGEGCEASK
jgi:hypothetical protein